MHFWSIGSLDENLNESLTSGTPYTAKLMIYIMYTYIYIYYIYATVNDLTRGN